MENPVIKTRSKRLRRRRRDLTPALMTMIDRLDDLETDWELLRFGLVGYLAAMTSPKQACSSAFMTAVMSFETKSSILALEQENYDAALNSFYDGLDEK